MPQTKETSDVGFFDSFLGKAGQFAVMNELLRLGYNVAVPEVDVGDDLFVLNDQASLFWRGQVKSAFATTQKSGARVGQYALRRDQLFLPKRLELFYVFAITFGQSWDYVVLLRKELADKREAFESKRGLRPREEDALNLKLVFEPKEVRGWEADFTAHRGAFERYFPRLSR